MLQEIKKKGKGNRLFDQTQNNDSEDFSETDIIIELNTFSSFDQLNNSLKKILGPSFNDIAPTDTQSKNIIIGFIKKAFPAEKPLEVLNKINEECQKELFEVRKSILTINAAIYEHQTTCNKLRTSYEYSWHTRFTTLNDVRRELQSNDDATRTQRVAIMLSIVLALAGMSGIIGTTINATNIPLANYASAISVAILIVVLGLTIIGLYEYVFKPREINQILKKISTSTDINEDKDYPSIWELRLKAQQLETIKAALSVVIMEKIAQQLQLQPQLNNNQDTSQSESSSFSNNIVSIDDGYEIQMHPSSPSSRKKG